METKDNATQLGEKAQKGGKSRKNREEFEVTHSLVEAEGQDMRGR